MSERDTQISERLKVLLPRLSDQDKRVLMAYGEGMADKAARRGGGKDVEVIDILLIVTLGVSLVDLALFGCCVWMGYQREKDRTRKGNR